MKNAHLLQLVCKPKLCGRRVIDWQYEATGSVGIFKDAADIATLYRDAVAWAVEKGITTGYNDSSFRPNDTCTRWAVVLFMYRDMK